MRVFAFFILVVAGHGAFVASAGVLSRCVETINRALGNQEKPLSQMPKLALLGNTNLDVYKDLQGSQVIHAGRIKIRYEARRLLLGENQRLNEMITAVEKEGGEIRILGAHASTELIMTDVFNYMSYFRIRDDASPIIALSKNATMPEIEHEFNHFLNWKKKRNQFLKEGHEADIAGHLSLLFHVSSLERYHDYEAAAVTAEIESGGLRNKFSDLERSIYPRMASIIRFFKFKEAAAKSVTAKEQFYIHNYVDSILREALAERRSKIIQLEKELAALSTMSFKKVLLRRKINQLRNLQTLYMDFYKNLALDHEIFEIYTNRLHRLVKNEYADEPWKL